MNSLITKFRSMAFVVSMLLLWFLSDIAWAKIDFPFNWIGFSVFLLALMGMLWLAKFSWWGLAFLAFSGLTLDPRLLVQFFDASSIRGAWFFLNLLLSMIDVAFVASLIVLLASTRLRPGVKVLILVPIVGILIYMIWCPHYRWI